MNFHIAMVTNRGVGLGVRWMGSFCCLSGAEIMRFCPEITTDKVLSFSAVASTQMSNHLNNFSVCQSECQECDILIRISYLIVDFFISVACFRFNQCKFIASGCQALIWSNTLSFSLKLEFYYKNVKHCLRDFLSRKLNNCINNNHMNWQKVCGPKWKQILIGLEPNICLLISQPEFKVRH